MLTRSTLLFVLAALPVAAEEKRPPKPDSLLGKWEIVSMTFDGRESKNAKGRVLVFDEKEFAAYEGENRVRSLKYTIDPKVDPKQINIERGADDAKAAGIYAVTKDELKLCYAEPGGVRPKKFQSNAGDKVFLIVLKRVKAE